MWKNYLTIGIRNLFKNKVYAVINILGLSVGMACCLLIFLFVNDELKYDRFQKHYDRIHRVIYHGTTGYNYATVPPPIQPLLKEHFPEVEASARAYRRHLSIGLEYQGKVRNFEEGQVLFADSLISDILSFRVLEGNPEKFYRQPFTVVLSQSVARKYFGDQPAYGQTFTINGKETVKVIGVVEDYPEQSHLDFTMIFPYEDMYRIENEATEKLMRENYAWNWVISHSYTYVLLKEGAETATVNEGFEGFVKKYTPEELQVGQSFSLEPMKDFHLYSDAEALIKPSSDIRYIYVFSMIAILTLVIACFNFINLSTASSISRTREVGVRKMLGAEKHQLFSQFLGEAGIVSFFAMLMALSLVVFTLPLLNQLTGKQVVFNLAVLGWSGIGLFVLLFVITGLLGGSYPSFILSKVKVIHTLKGKTGNQVHRGINLRRVLVAVQFTISIALIAGVLLIFNQLRYLQHKSMGFDTEQVLIVPVISNNLNAIFGGIDGQMRQRLNTFEDELVKHNNIKSSTLSSVFPGLGAVSRMVLWEGKPEDTRVFIPTMSVDYDFADTYGLQLLEGRNFNMESGADHISSFVINQSAVKHFGWQDPIGKEIDLEGKKGLVVGVVRDFHFTSLREPIRPLIMEVRVNFFNTLSIQVAEDIPGSLQLIENVWQKHFPEKAFEYYFLDQEIKDQFESDRRMADVLGIFSFIAIIISVMGSYGLILFLAKKREKEIGIRKILGASVPRLLRIMAAEFNWLFLAGFIMAVPLAYYFVSQWLENFSYRIDIQWWVFALSGGLSLAMVWISISYQSIKSALVNPIELLRDE